MSFSDKIHLACGGIAQLGEQVTSKATRNRNTASKKLITRKSSKIKGFRFHGGIAQLGERLNGIQEVSGSIPLISTNNKTVRPTPYGFVLSTVQMHLPASHNN